MTNQSFLGELINVFLYNQELLTFYVNSILLFLTGTVGVIYSTRWFNGYLHGYARIITGGIALTALGIFFNKIIFLIEDSGDFFSNNALIYNNIGKLTFIPIIMIIVGYLLHLSPYLKEYLKEQWMLKTTISFGLFFLFIVFFQTLVN